MDGNVPCLNMNVSRISHIPDVILYSLLGLQTVDRLEVLFPTGYSQVERILQFTIYDSFNVRYTHREIPVRLSVHGRQLTFCATIIYQRWPVDSQLLVNGCRFANYTRYVGGDTRNWMNLQTSCEPGLAEKAVAGRIKTEVSPGAE